LVQNSSREDQEIKIEKQISCQTFYGRIGEVVERMNVWLREKPDDVRVLSVETLPLENGVRLWIEEDRS
jgi:hypothetical protein